MNKKMKTTTDLLLDPIKEKISKSPLFSRFLDADLKDLEFFLFDGSHILREDLKDVNPEELWSWLYQFKKQFNDGYVVKYILKCKIKKEFIYEENLWTEWKIQGKTCEEFWYDHVNQIFEYVQIVWNQSKKLEELDLILADKKV